MHEASVAFVERAFNGVPPAYLAPASIVGFVRNITQGFGRRRGMAIADAWDVVDAWLAAPAVVLAVPDPRHFARVRTLMADANLGARQVDDAHLAALAQQFGATVATFDSGFARFEDVEWERPAA